MDDALATTDGDEIAKRVETHPKRIFTNRRDCLASPTFGPLGLQLESWATSLEMPPFTITQEKEPANDTM